MRYRFFCATLPLVCNISMLFLTLIGIRSWLKFSSFSQIDGFDDILGYYCTNICFYVHVHLMSNKVHLILFGYTGIPRYQIRNQFTLTPLNMANSLVNCLYFPAFPVSTILKESCEIIMALVIFIFTFKKCLIKKRELELINRVLIKITDTTHIYFINLKCLYIHLKLYESHNIACLLFI